MLCVDAAVADAHAGKARPPRRNGGKSKKKRRSPTASARPVDPRPIERTRPYAQCPPEMVSVRGQFCIDRWEATTVDAVSGRPLSPYYPPHPRLASLVLDRWTAEYEKEKAAAGALLDAGPAPIPAGIDAGGPPRVTVSLPEPVRHVILPDDADDSDDADEDETYASDAGMLAPDGGAPRRAPMALPVLPAWEQGSEFVPMAVSRPNVKPQGYTPGHVAAAACRAAGKRLCREDEWVTACKGERGHDFPYGPVYRQGACNVFREDHPARILHGDCSSGLSDPRLNLVQVEGADLLRETGGSPLCASRWGNDVIYDMVGNVDEWVDDPSGVFVGGFYARNTRKGCEARVAAHPTTYFDYSLGFRCCADLAQAPSR